MSNTTATRPARTTSMHAIVQNRYGTRLAPAAVTA